MLNLEALDLDPAVRDAVEALEDEVEIVEYSDKGANGYLFFGVHQILKERRAIKFYYWAQARTHDEPRLLSEINSDHIIPIHSARLVNEEWAMFQTPYYPRGDLDQVVKATPLSLHQAIDHVIEVLVGVSALHSANLVHRDLKPANIFIDEEGRARIGDFGSVIAIPDADGSAKGSGHSVLYRPPESFDSDEYSKAGDIYQCGFVLYQLLGGALPYEDEVWLDREGRRCWEAAQDDFDRSQCVSGAIARRAKRQQILDLGSLPGTVSGSLRSLIRRATRPDPVTRFSGASSFINALRRVRAGCKNWFWNGTEATALCDDREVRIVRDPGGEYRCEARREGDWRKLPGVDPGPIPALARYVDRAM